MVWSILQPSTDVDPSWGHPVRLVSALNRPTMKSSADDHPAGRQTQVGYSWNKLETFPRDRSSLHRNPLVHPTTETARGRAEKRQAYNSAKNIRDTRNSMPS